MYGEDGVLLDNGTRLVVLMDTLKVGYIKWRGGQVVDHRLGLVREGFVPPRRHELDDLDKSTWEVVKGEPKDPWSPTNEVAMIDPGTDKIFTFTTTSTGGFGAIAELAAGYSDELPYYPLVELTGSSYAHKNKAYGRIAYPVFAFVKNVDSAPYDAILAASRRGALAAAIDADASKAPKPISGPDNDNGGDDDGYPDGYAGGGRGPIDDSIPF